MYGLLLLLLLLSDEEIILTLNKLFCMAVKACGLVVGVCVCLCVCGVWCMRAHAWCQCVCVWCVRVCGVCVRAFVMCVCVVWRVRMCGVRAVWCAVRMCASTCVWCVCVCVCVCAPKDDPFGKLETILPILFHSFVLSLFSCVILYFLLLPLPFLLVSPLSCVLYNRFFLEDHTVYEMTIRRMHVACWIPKATNTVAEYIILMACPLQHERASALRCTVRTFRVLCLINVHVIDAVWSQLLKSVVKLRTPKNNC